MAGCCCAHGFAWLCWCSFLPPPLSPPCSRSALSRPLPTPSCSSCSWHPDCPPHCFHSSLSRVWLLLLPGPSLGAPVSSCPLRYRGACPSLFLNVRLLAFLFLSFFRPLTHACRRCFFFSFLSPRLTPHRGSLSLCCSTSRCFPFTRCPCHAPASVYSPYSRAWLLPRLSLPGAVCRETTATC